MTQPFQFQLPEIYGGMTRGSDMPDDLDEIVTRYAEEELTLEEAVEQAYMDRQAVIRILEERDIEIRPYPITRDTDEIIAYLARERIVPSKAPDGHIDAYGLVKDGQSLIRARAGAPGDMPPPEEVPPPPPAVQVIEKLGISSDEECERVRERIENHPEWEDDIPDDRRV